MVLNTSLNLILIIPFGHVGLALATSLSAWVNAGLLYYYLRRDSLFILDKRLKSRMLRIIASTLVMTGSLMILLPQLDNGFVSGGFARIQSLIVLIVVGIVSYIVASLVMGSLNKSELKTFITKKN